MSKTLIGHFTRADTEYGARIAALVEEARR